MTAAQRDYLFARGIDPRVISWHDADDLGFPDWGKSEAAVLPDGHVLLADGSLVTRDEERSGEAGHRHPLTARDGRRS